MSVNTSLRISALSALLNTPECNCNLKKEGTLKQGHGKKYLGLAVMGGGLGTGLANVGMPDPVAPAMLIPANLELTEYFLWNLILVNLLQVFTLYCYVGARSFRRLVTSSSCPFVKQLKRP